MRNGTALREMRTTPRNDERFWADAAAGASFERTAHFETITSNVRREYTEAQELWIAVVKKNFTHAIYFIVCFISPPSLERFPTVNNVAELATQPLNLRADCCFTTKTKHRSKHTGKKGTFNRVKVLRILFRSSFFLSFSIFLTERL